MAGLYRSQGIHARARRHPSRLLLSAVLPSGDPAAPPSDLAMERDALRAAAAAGGFWSYAAGVALVLLEGRLARVAADGPPSAATGGRAEGGGDSADSVAAAGPRGLEWVNYKTTLPLK